MDGRLMGFESFDYSSDLCILLVLFLFSSPFFSSLLFYLNLFCFIFLLTYIRLG